MQAGRAVETRIGELLADASELFEAYLWESGSGTAAREALEELELDEKMVRAFGVGYAPIRPDQLMNHLRALGYSTEELVTAGLANRSVRGRAHAHFHSRLMFPVKDEKRRTLGFAGLGTHLGPSWSLWITSPDVGLYRRSAAVFGLDRAARQIGSSGTASVKPDCIEVLRAHQNRQRNAVTVHTSWVTHEQRLALAKPVSGGIDALELELPPGMEVESKGEAAQSKVAPDAAKDGRTDLPIYPTTEPPAHDLKRLAIVIGTALAGINAWTGAPLLAVWAGSQVQTGRLLSIWGVITVVAVLALLEFLLGWALTWLSAKYDMLTGRPLMAGQTSPWHRSKRGDRVEDIRSRYGISAPEKVVAACVVAGVLVFEVWFFFFAGSPL